MKQLHKQSSINHSKRDEELQNPAVQSTPPYSSKSQKQPRSLPRSINYLLKEQRLLFILVGVLIASTFFILQPTLSNLGPAELRPLIHVANGNGGNSGNYVSRSRRVPAGIRKPPLRIVVTGGAGFVGSHLVDKLQRRIQNPNPCKKTQIEMAGIGPLTQDWEPVVIRKKAPTSAAKKDEKAVNAARRSGADIETVKKSNAGTNKAASSSTSLNTRKLDDETENLTHERVPTELKKSIMQARMDKKFTQAQLAQMINEKPQVIQEYEAGKAIPNQQIITKLERVLGVKLRGKK